MPACEAEAIRTTILRPQRRVPTGWMDDGLRSVNLELPNDQRL
jgi:hypothetical protein